jgi:hypothetical protein
MGSDTYHNCCGCSAGLSPQTILLHSHAPHTEGGREGRTSRKGWAINAAQLYQH